MLRKCTSFSPFPPMAAHVTGVFPSLSRVSGAAGPPAGVRALGLHQPFPEEIHGGHRQCDQEQQSLPAPGRAQVSFFEPQCKLKYSIISLLRKC